MANRYWVGGTDSWNGTAGSKWALTSGGAGGEAEPTSADDVFFDAASGVITVTVATTTGICNNLNFTGFTGTFAGSMALDIYGSLTVVAGMTLSYSSPNNTTFKATATGKTITLNGKTYDGNFVFNGVGGGWTFQDAVTLGSGKDITLTNGTLNTNGQTVSCDSFLSSNTNTRTLTLGASAINCNSWSCSTSTNLTFNANTSTITTSQGNVALGTSLTYNNLVVQTSASVSSTQISNVSCTVANLTLTGHASQTDRVIVQFTAAITISGTLTMNGNSIINRLLVSTNNIETNITLTAAVVSASNVDFMDITGAGAGSWDLSAITGKSGNCGGNVGITFTTGQTNYWVGNGGNWSDSANHWASSSGGVAGTGRVPLPQDNATFDVNSFSSGSQTVTVDMGRIGTNINWTGVTNTPAFDVGSQTPNFAGTSMFGSLTLVSGMTLTTTGTIPDLNFVGRSASTLTSAGLSFGGRTINIKVAGTTLTLQDALTLTETLQVANGTFDANNKTVTCLDFNSSNTNTRTVTMGSGLWTLTGSGTVWTTATTTNLTFNKNTANIKCTDTSATAVTFAGGGLTYNDLWFSRGASTANITLTGANTFADLKDDGSAAHSLRFTAGTTTTITTFTVSGTADNLITITSASAATHTLSKSSGTVSIDYVNISYSTATGGATWNADVHSTDSGNNSGWNFLTYVPKLVIIYD